MNLVLLLLILSVSVDVFGQLVTNPVDYIDVRVGVTGNTGACVIGPQLPYGSINPSPQTPNGGHDGYDPTQPIRGFGQLHASGTGWGKYGMIFLSPQIGLAVGETTHDSPKSNEVTFPYEYGVTLTKYNIRTEVTPSYHSALYKFTFPVTSDGNLLLDISHNIPQDISGIVPSRIVDVKVNIDTLNNTIRGYGTYYGGFGPGNYTVYFFARMDKKPVLYGTWKNGVIQPKDTVENLTTLNDRIGAYLKYSTTANEVVKMKIAVSFKSVAQAQKWVDTEIPDWDYDALRAKGKDAWNKEMSKILIEEPNYNRKIMFYSALYHTMVEPRDRTNDMVGFPVDAPVWDDYYAGWDIWRTAFPLMTLINQDKVKGNVNSFVERLKVNKRVMDTYIAGNDMLAEQGGNDVDNIIADAYVKGVSGVDWEAAYNVLKNNADNERLGFQSLNPNPLSVVTDTVQASYKKRGWIPAGTMSSSKSLEYSYNDFCVAQVAKGLGKTADYNTYYNRSLKWENLWNPNATSYGFKGFIVPKNTDGSFVDIDLTYYWGSWHEYFYEGTAWDYSCFIPHQFDKMVYLSGGPEMYAHRLDSAFQKSLINYGNEPSFLSPSTFNYAKRQDLMSYWVRKVMSTFNATTGYPGNEDGGAMSSWYIFSALGFFPNAGQDIYYINGPLYAKSVITLANDKTITIEAENAGIIYPYVQSCTINGVSWNKTWFRHSDIKNGATIHFVMGQKPSDWGKADNSLQYNFKETGLINPVKATQGFIYPNPASNMITIDMQNIDYRQMSVVDATGRLVMTKKIDTNSKAISLNVKGWNKGTYFVSLRNDKGVTNSKLLVN